MGRARSTKALVYQTDMAMRFDEILRNYYSRAADMATSEQVADVFRNLRSREEENRNSKVQDALLLKDL